MIPVPLVSNQYSINILHLRMTVHVIIEPISISAATKDDVLIGSIFIGTIALLVMIIIITVTVMCINSKRYYDRLFKCMYFYCIVYRYCQEKI